MTGGPLKDIVAFNTDWPKDGLIDVASCPVCNGAERQVLYSDCVDVTFRTAPGRWTMWKCCQCASAWLNPMPSPEKIGLAYSSYYTHEVDDNPADRRLSKLRTLIHNLKEGYAEERYCAKSNRATNLGRWLTPLIPPVRSAVDADYRHLPTAPPGGRLLDIGCGNGTFLVRAERMGWDAVGLELDQKAVSVARKRGLNVRAGSVEILDAEAAEQYDIVTLSHVIEHVHNPRGLINCVYRLLKPGGHLWLETPNLNSLGHRKFHQSWRGLEVPRHLVLFNHHSLKNLLATAGFGRLSQKWRGLVLFDVYAQSKAIRRREDPLKPSSYGRPLLREFVDELREMLRPELREFLTFTAVK